MIKYTLTIELTEQDDRHGLMNALNMTEVAALAMFDDLSRLRADQLLVSSRVDVLDGTSARVTVERMP